MNAEDVFIAFFGFLFLCAWPALVIFGVKAAKEKGRSPHWMWFGLHPLGALIVFIVMLSVKPLKQCSQCMQKVYDHAQICPYCRHAFEAAPASLGGSSTLGLQ